MADFRASAQQLHQQVTTWRRDLHRIPETGVDTPQTEAYICAELDKIGVSYRKGLGRHGVVALVEGKHKNKVFAIRADMDGLPIKEETGLPFASQNGCMHACGHDAHAAMGLGSVKLLHDVRDQIEGSVLVVFQPGEEGCTDGPGGAKRMLDDGAFDDPKPDAMVGLHTGSIWKGFVPGEIGYRPGGIMACMDRFDILIKGKGAHGANPQGSVDPISIAGQIICELQTIISREVDPQEPCVISLGEIHAGSAFNIIPGECRITGTVRAFNQEMREFLARRIGEVASAVASGMRGSVEFSYGWHGPSPVVNDPVMTEELRLAAEKIVGPEKVREIPRPSMGGEDVAFFLDKAPGTFFFIPGCNEAKGQTWPHHNSRFDIDEDVLWIGPAVMATMAFDWLKKQA